MTAQALTNLAGGDQALRSHVLHPHHQIAQLLQLELGAEASSSASSPRSCQLSSGEDRASSGHLSPLLFRARQPRRTELLQGVTWC